MLIPKKYHIHVIALLAVAAIIFFPNMSKKPEPEVLSRGTAAAEEFLRLVDNEKYAESLEASSALMKAKIVPEVWHRQISLMREKVGALVRRSQEESTLSNTAEGAPDGEYLTLRYSSAFDHQQLAIESVILAREKDGEWRVAGYFIK